MSAEIRYLPDWRLKELRIDEAEEAESALNAARSRGEPVIRCNHGGSTPNGYIRDTEGCVTVAFPDGRLWQYVKRVPAVRVTLAGVFRRVTGMRGLFDKRYGKKKQYKCRWELLRKIEEQFQQQEIGEMQ